MLPKQLDEKVARLHLDQLGVRLTKLSKDRRRTSACRWRGRTSRSTIGTDAHGRLLSANCSIDPRAPEGVRGSSFAVSRALSTLDPESGVAPPPGTTRRERQAQADHRLPRAHAVGNRQDGGDEDDPGDRGEVDLRPESSEVPGPSRVLVRRAPARQAEVDRHDIRHVQPDHADRGHGRVGAAADRCEQRDRHREPDRRCGRQMPRAHPLENSGRRHPLVAGEGIDHPGRPGHRRQAAEPHRHRRQRGHQPAGALAQRRRQDRDHRRNLWPPASRAFNTLGMSLIASVSRAAAGSRPRSTRRPPSRCPTAPGPADSPSPPTRWPTRRSR